MSVSRDIKDFTKLIFFSLLTCLIKYMKITSGLWDIINKVVTKLKKNGACVFLSTVFFSKSFGGKIRHNWTDVTYRIKLKKKKKRRMRIISTRIFLSFLGGKNKNFWTALNTSFFSERQKIVLEKVQLNRVIIFPYIFLLTRRVLREIYQFCFVPLLNLVFLFSLIHAWSIRDSHHSFYKKLKIIDKQMLRITNLAFS